MKYIERAFPWLLTAPVILPVVFWGGLVYPYLVPKTLLFYALSLVTLAAFGLLVTSGVPSYWSRLRQWSAWVPGALLVLAYVASWFGLGFYHSFWSIYVRGDGLLMLTGVVLYFYLILIYANRAFFEWFVKAVALVASLVAVYGIGEWMINGGRIGSLLGNAAFFAGYLGIALFATLAAAQSLRDGWRRAAYAGAVLEVIGIVLTATRGTILALGAAVAAVLIFWAWKGQSARYRNWSRGILLALVVLTGLFIGFRGELAHVPFAPVARLASISTSDPDVASRLFVWKNMLGQIEKHPVLGVGAEHIDALFNQFYDPSQIQEEWFDRSHNAFLDYAAQYGVGGLVLYLLLIGSLLVAAHRYRTRGERVYAGIYALLALTYAVQNFFVFDTISSFWLLVALLAGVLADSGEPAEPAPLAFPNWARYGAWLLALVLVALIIPISVRPLIAAYDLAQGYAYAIIDPAKSDAYITNGFSLGTYADLDYGYEVYAMYTDPRRSLTGQALRDAYQSTEPILATDFDRYPYDARTALYLAHVLTTAPPDVTPDSALLTEALTRVLKESPKRYQAWYILINLSIAQANTYLEGSSERAAGYAAARDLLNRYIALVPKLSEPHYVLAQLLVANGDSASADAQAALGKQYYVSDATTAVRAAQYYEQMQDWQNAQYFLAQVMKLSPTNYALVYDLAKVDFLLGQQAASEQVVQYLRQNDPSIIATDQNFLNAITTYERTLPQQ